MILVTRDFLSCIFFKLGIYVVIALYCPALSVFAAYSISAEIAPISAKKNCGNFWEFRCKPTCAILDGVGLPIIPDVAVLSNPKDHDTALRNHCAIVY